MPGYLAFLASRVRDDLKTLRMASHIGLPLDAHYWLTKIREHHDALQRFIGKRELPAEPIGFLALIKHVEELCGACESQDTTAPERVDAQAGCKQAADDESAYVLASTLWPARWASYKRFRTWLRDNQIRNKQRGRRRYVHSGDFQRAVADEDRKAFDALDASAAAVDAFVQRASERQANLCERKAAEKASGQ